MVGSSTNNDTCAAAKNESYVVEQSGSTDGVVPVKLEIATPPGMLNPPSPPGLNVPPPPFGPPVQKPEWVNAIMHDISCTVADAVSKCMDEKVCPGVGKLSLTPSGRGLVMISHQGLGVCPFWQVDVNARGSQWGSEGSSWKYQKKMQVVLQHDG